MNWSEHPYFVIPFVVGMAFLLLYLSFIYVKWLLNTSFSERKKILVNIFTIRTIRAVGEVVSECLLHRRIFKFNPTLGYMHMSLAFGWLLLIVVGKTETMLFLKDGFNAPYMPVFFKYFYPDLARTEFFGKFFLNLMDVLLIFVLSGLFLAIYKRFGSKKLGMKRTTRHIMYDRVALTFLWFIFPMRWLAESLTSGVHNSGGFFTHASGHMLASFLPAANLQLPAWWAYSFALGGFFVALPFSRYMHIFTEAGLIFLKHWGLKTASRENGYASFEINSCSRCGICTNVCQLSDAGISYPHAVYFLRDLRYNRHDPDTLNNCLLCGRCSSICPVDIGVDQLRLRERRKAVNKMNLPYLWKSEAEITEAPAKVLYFAGCMTHITPSILYAVKDVLECARVEFAMLDETGGLCCGRPLIQAGLQQQADSIMSRTSNLINRSNASLLLVSCPICYKVFKEDYKLNIPVEHHSVYFSKLMAQQPSLFKKQSLCMTYHDPCDLGRGSGIYNEPREVIRRVASLIPAEHEFEDALCCGGSLANLTITPQQRGMITDAAFESLTRGKPDYVVSACPLCKKTFQQGKRDVPVIDIAEALQMSLQVKAKAHQNHEEMMELIEC